MRGEERGSEVEEKMKRKEKRRFGIGLMILSAYIFIFLVFGFIFKLGFFSRNLSVSFFIILFLLDYLLFIVGIVIFLGKRKIKSYLRS